MSRPPRLADVEISARLAGLPRWTIAGGKLRREFQFSDFSEAFGFMARVALAAEKLDHHPDWSNVWNRVTVELSTHDAGGITELDFELATVMDRLVSQARATPIQTSVGAISVSFSAGVAAFGVNDSEILPMLEKIDHALYRAKADGRDQVRMATQSSVPWNSALLRQALTENRVRQASQVIVDLQSGLAIADEALARIETATGEMVEAKDFVDMAEGLGLMAEIDRQVIRNVMQRCVTRMDQGGASDFAHFVNVSPQFLARRDLVEEMLNNAMGYCQTCSVLLGPVKPIVLELTERQRIVSLEKLRADLQPFIDFGFRLALDDFGSGYSSYLYLAHLPVSFLKIEGWLVSHMRQDRKVAGIVESLANFARKEGMLTVAEHVEDAETARILADMGVDYGQGWHFGRPQLV